MANGFSSYRLGIDIGGTFTDGVLVDEATGELSLVKVPSTPRDPSVGFMEAVKKILANRGIPPAAVRFAVHGTTVATNTIIEGKGARAGFLATQGFRDLLEIAFQTRPSLYDIFYDKPKPLIPRSLCLGVPERIDADGVVQAPLDEAALRQAARQLKREGVEAIVVCFLHSYRNPAHERRAAEILAEECPGVALSISSEVCPEFREYVRASTTAVNAVLMPIVGQYVDRLQSRIVEAGMGSGLHLMTSGGGIIAGETARRSPVHLIESGPAAGVMAAAFWGEMTGRRQILALDIGGTTAKAALIQDGRPAVASEFEVGRAAVATTTRNKGQGYPVKTPVIDLVEIGAGGGSIGWVDPGGALAVGPQSAGADPGPAGYGRGGSEPTLTDANLILGRLNPDYFLGGEVKLDPGLARAALHERISARLAMDEVTAAHGMVEIANASMAGALHLITVQRGLDPRSFSLVAFGGAGPVHAVALARGLGIPEIVIPMSPGVTSALGLLVTDLKHEYSRTYIQAMARVDWAHVNQVYREFEDRAAAVLRREGVAPDKVRFLRAMDMRFAGQSYELTIPVPGGTLGPDQIGEITQTFFAEHERAYGFAARSEPAEVVTLRLTAIGRVTRPRVRQVPAGDEDGGGARKGTRRVYFAEADGWIDAALYDRYALREGNRIVGPAIVEEMDSTTVIPPACVARVDRYGNLIIGGGEGKRRSVVPGTDGEAVGRGGSAVRGRTEAEPQGGGAMSKIQRRAGNPGKVGMDRRGFLKVVAAGAAASPFAGGLGGVSRKAYAQKVKLRFLTATAYPEFQRVFQNQAERYGKLNPNVEVSVDLAGWEEVVAKSAKAFAAGTPYDVTEVPSDETFFNLQQKGIYAPVTDVVKELGGDAYFVPTILSFAQHKGDYWGLPLRQTVLVHWYHKAWYDEAGLKWPANWDEFLRKAKTLTNPQKERFGAMVPLATAYFPTTWVVSLIWMNGGHILDAKGDVAFDSPATYGAIDFVRKLWEFAPPGSAQYNAPEMRSTFIQGKVADTYYSSFLLPSDIEKFNPGLAGKVDIAPLVPPKTGGEIMSRMTGAYLSISSKTKHPREARDFARYLVQPDNLIEWNSGLMESQAFTIHAALKSEKVLGHPLVRKYNDWFTRYQEYAQRYGRPVTQENKGVVTPKTAEILGDLLLAKCMQEVILQKQDIEKTVKKYAELMRKVVARPA